MKEDLKNSISKSRRPHKLMINLAVESRAKKAWHTKWYTKWHSKWYRYIKEQFTIISSNHRRPVSSIFKEKNWRDLSETKPVHQQMLASYYVASQKNSK